MQVGRQFPLYKARRALHGPWPRVPAMSERSRLYQNEITRLGHGHPVWEPNPGTLYDRVRIGDVGYFDMGQFIPIFNILPPDDEQHNRGLPFPQHNFPLLYLPSGLPHSRNRTPLEAGVHSLESNSTHFATIGINRWVFFHQGNREEHKGFHSPVVS